MKDVHRVNEAVFSFTGVVTHRSLFFLRQVRFIRTKHDGRLTYHVSFNNLRRIGHSATGVHFPDVLIRWTDLGCSRAHCRHFSGWLFLCPVHRAFMCLFSRSLSIVSFSNHSDPFPVHRYVFSGNVLRQAFFFSNQRLMSSVSLLKSDSDTLFFSFSRTDYDHLSGEGCIYLMRGPIARSTSSVIP